MGLSRSKIKPLRSVLSVRLNFSKKWHRVSVLRHGRLFHFCPQLFRIPKHVNSGHIKRKNQEMNQRKNIVIAVSFSVIVALSLYISLALEKVSVALKVMLL